MSSRIGAWADDADAEEQRRKEQAENEITDDDFATAMLNMKKPKPKKMETTKPPTRFQGAKCSKCGSKDPSVLSETEYAKFKPYCEECVSAMAAKSSCFIPPKNYFRAKCASCSSTQDICLFMFKPGFFKIKCQSCCEISE